MDNIDNISSSKDIMLDTLFEISNTFNGLLNQNQIFKQLAMYLMGHFAITQFAIYVLNETNEYVLLEHKNLNYINNVISSEMLGFIKDVEIIKCEQEHQTLFNNNDIEYIITTSKSTYFLVTGRRMLKQNLSDIDFKFMRSACELALLAIENSRLIKKEKDEAILESELKTTLEIQRALLPKSNPNIDNYDIIGYCKSAKIVGGDYYDFIKIDKDRYLIVIADVCGKSIPAALIMSNLQSALKAQLFYVSDLKKIAINLNRIIYENTDIDKFITFFFGILDIKKNEFEYINCGHNAPILYKSRDKNVELLKAKVAPIGAFIPSIFDNYESVKIYLDINDSIVCYTDGVIEAKNVNSEILGEKWLINYVKDHHHFNAIDILQGINNMVIDYQFMQNDDITLVVIKRKY